MALSEMSRPRSLAALVVAVSFIVIGIASFTTPAQALPPGIHCSKATAENQIEPPPPLWAQKHEAPPAVAPQPLCPAGTVPTTVPGANGSTSVTAPPPITPSPVGGNFVEPLSERFESENTGPYYYAGDGWHPSTAWYGISVGIGVGNPTLSSGGIHSLGQIAAANDETRKYTAEAGWQRTPSFGSGSRLFTYVNKDKYTSNGEPGGDCYNCITPAEGTIFTQNQELEVGRNPQFTVEYFKGNWWFGLGYAGATGWIGYESGAFWAKKFISTKWMSVYGEVLDTSGRNSQMGNGTIGTKPGALVMLNPYRYEKNEVLVTITGHKSQEANPFPNDLPNYNVGEYTTSERQWRYGGV